MGKFAKYRNDDYPDPFKFEKHGDTITGRLVECGETDYNGKADQMYPVCVFDTGEEKLRSVVATQVLLRKELDEEDPDIGDTVTITYTGDSKDVKPGRSPAKVFTVKVKRSNGSAAPTAEPETAPADDDDFADAELA